MARPSLVGTAAISRAIGAPLLGEMNTPPESWTLAALPDAGSYIELAADSQQVQEVRFAVLDPNGRRRARVRMLEGPLHRLRFTRSRTAKQSAEAARNGRSAEPNPGNAGELLPAAARQVPGAAAAVSRGGGAESENSDRIGLVVAIPRVLEVADINAVTNFIWISGWTLLGVIVFPAKRKAATIARRGSRPADSRHDDSVNHDVEVEA